jgi:hypothetical protein
MIRFNCGAMICCNYAQDIYQVAFHFNANNAQVKCGARSTLIGDLRANEDRQISFYYHPESGITLPRLHIHKS